MTERMTKAISNHKSGYNCSQSVVCAYCDLFGIDEETAFRMAEGMGFGLGGLKETCGAVTAMALLAGLKNSDGALDAPKTKKETYRIVRMMGERFREMNQSTSCAELMGGDGKPKLRSCDGCIEDAAQIVEELLMGWKNEEIEPELEAAKGETALG